MQDDQKFNGVNLPNVKVLSPALVAVIRVSLLLPVYALSRLSLWFFNPGLFEPSGYVGIILGGLRFDLAALLMVNLLIFILSGLPLPFRNNRVYRKSLDILFILLNTLALIPSLADAFYFPFSMKRTGWEVFSFLKDGGGGDLWNMLPDYLRDFWPATLMLLAFIVMLIWLVRKLPYPRNRGMKLRTYIADTLIFLVIAAVSLVGIRGGFQLKPINILSASAYAGPRNTPLVYGSTFSIIKTYGIASLTVPEYFRNETEMLAWFNALKTGDTSVQMNRKNVVVIILESFSSEYFRSMNPKAGNNLTPFLDSLCSQSLCYKGISNSKRSIEALPAILSGLPNLMIHDYITSPYAGNEINSLASLLRTKGYTTSFFHGGNNGTMGFDAFCRMAGFEKYYGRNEYPVAEDFDGKWGIWDHKFFPWFAQQLNQTSQPFFSSIFSLSSHHPYSIPPELAAKFPAGKQKIEATIAYSDYALSLFFNVARTMPWFSNTLFVITADHTSETTDSWYQTRAGMYSIPIIFYQPDQVPEDASPGVVQQTDIMPSVLDYLNYPGEYIAFGNSVFSNPDEAFAVNFVNPDYTVFMKHYMMTIRGDTVAWVYDLAADPFQLHNVQKKADSLQQRMENCGKSLIMQYNERMIRNRLIPGR